MKKVSKFDLTKIKAIILSVIIAIVLAGFVIYLIESFHPNKQWDDYCENVRGPKVIQKEGEIINETQCVSEGGKWRNGYCDYYYECQEKYNKENEKHKLVVFVVAVPAGLVSILIGIVLALPSVSSGLMLGGGFLTLYGVSQYWTELSNWIRALILGIFLIVLIWVAYKKLRN